MLRAVWTNDLNAFESIWAWTQKNLQIRKDRLFAWKYKDRVIDSNAATDADTDIALALVLAERKFNRPQYLQEAQAIINDIWNHEVLAIQDEYYITGGNWAPAEPFPTLHVAYLAPYAYEVFAQIDTTHPWKRVIISSYRILNWIFLEKHYRWPPMKLFVDKATGQLMENRPTDLKEPEFSYDAFPIYWRVALDARWFGRNQGELRKAMLDFPREEWQRRGQIYDRYSLDGRPLSHIEGQPLYATLHSLALVQEEPWEQELRKKKLDPLWTQSLKSEATPYYLQNWVWFDRAFELEVALHFTEFLGFLRPFDFKSFSGNFPFWTFGISLLLFLFSRRFYQARWAFAIIACGLCGHYLIWRLTSSLNFMETAGPVISLALWSAEAYCFFTVVLLIVQVGLRKPKAQGSATSTSPNKFQPPVDIFIPIYSEPLSILENTLWAALNIDYPNKKVFVCDDSRADAVRELTERLGGHYILGPKKHAKAGNMNNALEHTDGELVVIFDTDHIPVKTFLNETVPYFADPKMGFVQTPHHFFNEDIFQRAFWTKDRIPNEQDMFNHGIQAGRNSWGGSFFVGSGAVFRRKAINEVGGFNYMSITEDIHTSQHLHGKGWTSAFVDKDLAVGLTAENLMSYLVQRRRWMLGCLQIFFKDNPLFCKGLSPRQRWGYFASLIYFFFPIVRTVFLFTPLFFLIFHWHPIFSEISVLLAHLIPFMVLLPLLSSLILPSWPRMFWGTIYENVVALPLARSMFDLFLPKNLGFKVTPKGIVSERRSFDFQSSRLTLIITGLTLFAIGKGFWEFYYFQIEKDAYFFNLAWAIYNFFSLLLALAVAWENPQRRAEDRIRTEIPFEFRAGDFSYAANTRDMSLTGIGFVTPNSLELPRQGELILKDGSGIKLQARLVYNEKTLLRTYRIGLQFLDLSQDQRRDLLLHLFTDPKTWTQSHETRVRTNFGMGVEFFKSILKISGSLIPFTADLIRSAKVSKGIPKK